MNFFIKKIIRFIFLKNEVFSMCEGEYDYGISIYRIH